MVDIVSNERQGATFLALTDALLLLFAGVAAAWVRFGIPGFEREIALLCLHGLLHLLGHDDGDDESRKAMLGRGEELLDLCYCPLKIMAIVPARASNMFYGNSWSGSINTSKVQAINNRLNLEYA